MLYELGGLIVVHDASGCNSTYSTHDEPRWYQKDSMIYISALTEMDAVLGNDDRLIGDIVRAARELKPRFIALCGSPMPMMIGTDFSALAEILESETGLPVFGLHTNGMNSYLDGASQALCAYLKHFCKKEKTVARSVNIIGATPLDFSLNGTVESIRNWLIFNHFSVISTMAMESSPEIISRAGNATVNLVISSCGIRAAEYLKDEFGIPYVTGVPFGRVFSSGLIAALETAEETGICSHPHIDRTAPETGGISIVGESTAASSLAYAISKETGHDCRVICPAALQPQILAPCDRSVDCEDSISAAFAGADVVIADPLFKPVCPDRVNFISYPHEAFSGRCFSGEIPNLICRDLKQEIILL